MCQLAETTTNNEVFLLKLSIYFVSDTIILVLFMDLFK